MHKINKIEQSTFEINNVETIYQFVPKVNISVNFRSPTF
jgi:hypothetical protein